MIRRWLCVWRGHVWIHSPISKRYRRCKRCGAEQVYYDKLGGWA